MASKIIYYWHLLYSHSLIILYRSRPVLCHISCFIWVRSRLKILSVISEESMWPSPSEGATSGTVSSKNVYLSIWLLFHGTLQFLGNKSKVLYNFMIYVEQGESANLITSYWFPWKTKCLIKIIWLDKSSYSFLSLILTIFVATNICTGNCVTIESWLGPNIKTSLQYSHSIIMSYTQFYTLSPPNPYPQTFFGKFSFKIFFQQLFGHFFTSHPNRHTI